MGSAGWRAVIVEEAPCHACGKPDWCSVSADGNKAACRRQGNGSGLHRVDKSGQDYWLYDLDSQREAGTPENEPRAEQEAPDRADPEVVDRVYGALLDELSLSQPHKQDLRRRELPEDRMGRGDYRTLPRAGREELARGLVYRFGSEVCSRVPGLYEKETGLWSVAGAQGMLVPVRDAEGRVSP